MTVDLLLYILALVCFVAAAVGAPTARFNLVAVGLALWVLTNIV